MEEMKLGGQSAWSKDFKTYFGDPNRQKQDKYRGRGSLIVEKNNLIMRNLKTFGSKETKIATPPFLQYWAFERECKLRGMRHPEKLSKHGDDRALSYPTE
jgi:hypothetical protein